MSTQTVDELNARIKSLEDELSHSIELPKDADGVPIHLGDKVYQGKGGWVYTVKSINFYPGNTTVTFDCKHGFGCDSPHNIRHYHAPTVEDVLWEMHYELYEVIMARWASECTIGEYSKRVNEIVDEYATKLNLANDWKEQ